jgi:hypothetical protein
LGFAYKDGTGWHVSTVKGAADPGFGANPSLALNGSGIPHISFQQWGDLNTRFVWYAIGTTSSGGSWYWENIPAASHSGQTAIAFDTYTNAPCILYYEEYSTGYMKFTCKNTTWSSLQVVADSGNVGRRSSLVLDGNDRPYIAYQDRLNTSLPAFLKTAAWSTTPAGCTNPDGNRHWECEEVDSSTDGNGRGLYNSIAINPLTGLPAIAYVDELDDIGLGYAEYVGSGGNCTGNTAWSCILIERDALIMPGLYPQLAFDSSGSPVIAYITGREDASNPSLKLASYVGSSMTGDCNISNYWDCEVVDSALGTYGGMPSLALTTTGKAVISYYDSIGLRLRLATQVDTSGTGCAGSTNAGKWKCIDIDTGLPFGFIYSSLVLQSDTEARISYSTNYLSKLEFASVTLPSGTPSIDIAASDNGGWENSMVLYQGIPWIAYNDYTDSHISLHLTHWVGVNNGNCGYDSAWQCEILDNTGSVGLHPFFVINTAGMAYISYYDESNGDLKLAYTRLFSFMPLLKKP